MLPSKSCKTINTNFLLKNFGLTFFDRFKTGTYLVNWFGRYRCRCLFIGRSLQHSNLIINKLYKGEKLKKNGHSFQDVKGDTKNEESQFFSNTFIFVENLQLGNASPHF